MAEVYKVVVSDSYVIDTHNFEKERKKVILLITEQHNRITRARELLLSEAIDSGDYKIMKSECEEKIKRYEATIKEYASSMNEELSLMTRVDKALEILKNLPEMYKEADIEQKRYIIGSIFPQKWCYDRGLGRTVQANIAAELIYQINNKLGRKKTGVRSKIRNYSG